MKAAVISLGSVSSQWVAEALKKYFDEVEMVQLKEIEVSLGKEAGVLYHGQPLQQFDCIYIKGSFRYANLLSSIATMLEKTTPYLPLRANSYTIVHNKLLTHLVLQQHNIPMPKTYVSSTIAAAKDLLKKIHYPIVMKFPEGTQGKGVMFADSESSAASMLDALGALKQPFIVQEFIETDGTDIRALVVGEKVVASMQRRASGQEKRANIHAGGTGESVQLSPEAMKIALRTAEALGADVCGVDILESPLGPLVIEANISPGLQGLQEVSTINVADQIAKHFHYKTESLLKKDKVKAASKVMKEIDNGAMQEIITDLNFRGERILLPEIVTKIAKFDDRKEYSVKVKMGKVEIESI
jgi:ribosomal protein S6--L-glutamate ligase